MGLKWLDMPQRGLYAAFAVFAITAALMWDAVAQPAPSDISGCVFLSSPATLADKQTAALNCNQLQRLKVETSQVSGGTDVVGGPVADDAAASGNPVPVGGIYNSSLPAYTSGDRTQFQFGANGELRSQLVGSLSSGVDGIANSATVWATRSGSQTTVGPIVMSPMLFNGSTWDREFTCPNSAIVNVAAAATTQIVALASSQIIRVCSFVISGDTLATTATFVYGTGANCGTGTTSLTGAMRLADEGNISATGANGSLFRTIASNALCLTAATGAVTGFVTYAQY